MAPKPNGVSSLSVPLDSISDCISESGIGVWAECDRYRNRGRLLPGYQRIPGDIRMEPLIELPVSS